MTVGSRSRTTPRLALLVTVLLATTVACGGGDTDDAAAPTEETTSSLPAVSTTEPPAPEDVDAADWEQIEAPADCECSDGTPYRYWIRQADPTKVLYFLEGGGACFNAATCGPASPTFTRNLVDRSDDVVPAGGGIFALEDERNPFADWSMVFVPYCTGDLHLGAKTQDYGEGVVIEHKGAVNARTALDAAAEAFPDAEQVVVAGSSAGSAGAPLYAGLAHDALPEADITLLADASAAYPDDEGITAAIGALWGAFERLPEWPEQTGPPPGAWTLPRMLVQAGRHVPDMRLATINSAYDEVQASFSALIGRTGDLLEMIDANNALVESEGIDLRTWVGPGTEHTVLGRESFYTDEVDGTSLRDWVADLVAGEDVPDVHCTECAAR